MPLPDNCERCGAESKAYAFVTYEPHPNDAQKDTDWGSDMPALHSIVCTECGHIIGVFDPEALDFNESSADDDFKVEEELR